MLAWGLRYILFHLKVQSVEVVLIILGVYIILETFASLIWPNNDKGLIVQGIRSTRILVGVAIIMLATFK